VYTIDYALAMICASDEIDSRVDLEDITETRYLHVMVWRLGASHSGLNLSPSRRHPVPACRAWN
jgi:hypothetical protein